MDDSYDASIIPFGIQRAMTRLLRDYHFPWSVAKATIVTVSGARDFILPAGFKKELMVMFYDTADDTYTLPLLKREGMVLPGEDGVPRQYWLWGNNLSTDIKIEAGDVATTRLVLWYESLDWAVNEGWMIDRFEDMIFTYATFRLAAELNKPELAGLYGQLWGDDRSSLAVYLNELEFDNAIFMQREAANPRSERYPAS